MSIAKKHKRKPFGTSAGNVLILKKRSVNKTSAARHHSSQPSPPTHGGKRKPHPNESKRGGASSSAHNNAKSFAAAAQKESIPNNAAAKRRNSKTPKTSNLTAAGGAYDLNKEFDLARPRGKQQNGLPKRTKPDPSPTKRPDPSAAASNNNAPLLSKTKRSSKSTKRDSTTASSKSDNFISASLKRLFPSKESTKNHHNAKSAQNERAKESKGSNPPGRHHAASSTMDADTACSTPEQDSPLNKSLDRPLVKSPLTKPDPIAKAAASKRVERDAKKPAAPSKDRPELSTAPRKKAAPKAAGANDKKLTNAAPNEMLDRARTGPTDNKRVLEAMLKSGNDNRRPKTTENEAAAAPLVGSIVGGASLQRSDSADESEVTTMDDEEEEMSDTSMTTRADHVIEAVAPSRNAPPTRNGGSVSDIFRSNASRAAPSDSNNVSVHQQLRRANAIESQAITEQQTSSLGRDQPPPPSTTQLPSGWKKRWSKTKQKPYYVHPDFGSTWHCPGLISNVHTTAAAGQSELFDHQRVFMGTSYDTLNNASQMMPKSIDANHNMTHSSTQAGSVVNFKSNFNEYAEQNGNDDTSRVEEVARDDPSKDASSTDISTKCLTQDFESNYYAASTLGQADDNDEEPLELHNDAPVEFDDNQGGGFDEAYEDEAYEDEGHEQFNGEEQDQSLDTKFDQASDDDGESVLDTAASNQQDDEMNSLASDHVDVNALLRNGARKAKSPLMPTIKEFCNASDGGSRQSSEASINDDLAGLKVFKDDSPNDTKHSPEASSHAYTITVDYGNIDGYDDQSPTFESNAGAIDNSDSESEVVVDTVARQTRRRKSSDVGVKKETKASSLRSQRCKKKIFPPGPLCSLQFLEEIETQEFDTPLWRRMKRKRSTLTSVKRGKAAQKERRRRRASFS